jgi:hypothetical protein
MAGVATFHFLGAGPSAIRGMFSVSEMAVGWADVDRRDPSTVICARTPSSRTPVASAETPSLGTSVVTGACVSSAYASVDTSAAVSETDSEVGGCAIVTSRQSVGKHSQSSRLSSVSLSL